MRESRRVTLHRSRGPRGFPARAVLLALAMVAFAGIGTLTGISGVAAAGPPFPDPVTGQRVYDGAEVLRAATKEQAQATIVGIEARTGAQVVVYTQLTSDDITTAQAEQDAIALMDQWGVGRKGFDDGLVILFDLHRSDPCHGQVQLYAGPGYQATFLSNEERQAIFENDMVPRLQGCDLDGALLAALAKIDANATPEHAGTLEFARQLNAVLGLLVAPLLALALVGWGLLSWLLHGRDPVYLDDASIHLPAPPKGLTPAAGAVVRDGRATRRALTAASLDLATRGLIGFRAEPGALIASNPKIGIRTGDAVSGDPVEQARLLRVRDRPMDDGTSFLLSRLATIAGSGGYIEPERITELGGNVAEFNKRVETHVVTQGWFRERPSQATGRWVARGVVVLVLGFIGVIVGVGLPSSGVVLISIGLLVAGVVLLILSASMPARTMPGAMIRAMLEAYRRTLEKTMAQARSMGEVVTMSAIPLIENPDDAVAWGVALGLQSDVERVLERTAEDLQSGARPYGYMPLWYASGAATGGSWGASSGPGGVAPGLMSSSPIPNFGGMMAALGTIGNSPASSGSGSGGGGGGGGFGGGSSGGGGGGAGGGF